MDIRVALAGEERGKRRASTLCRRLFLRTVADGRNTSVVMAFNVPALRVVCFDLFTVVLGEFKAISRAGRWND